jgi:hypothetical protein
MTSSMNRAVLAAAVLAAAACGGKAKSTTDLSASTCCCSSEDRRDVIGEVACEERGGTCEPAETCDAADPDERGDGGSDPDDY